MGRKLNPLEASRRAVQVAANGFDWLFRRRRLVKSGKTAFELVHQGDPMAVRHYSLAGEDAIELADGSRMPIERRQYAVPLVLVPPLGVISECFDLMPQRSLVRYMAARGFKTYLIDWGRPQKRHAHLGLADYADRMLGEALQQVRRHSGIQVGSRVAELDRIECPLLVFAGQSDHLVPPQVARKSVEVVASADKDFRTAPGGHMGVILGSKAQKAVWAQSADWLAVRSQHAPHPVPLGGEP
jgi:poly(3-hydroxyalkanoate) synthetase